MLSLMARSSTLSTRQMATLWLVLMALESVPMAALSLSVWFVAPGASGDGARGAPLGSIQAAIDLAVAGDVILVAPGTYSESLDSARDGALQAPIEVRAEIAGSVLVTASGQVLDVAHEHNHFVGLVFDGQYGANDTVRIRDAATGTQLRRVEVRRSSRDCVDVGSTSDVLIEDSLIHRCLYYVGGVRDDGHGVVAEAARRLVIRRTEIHTFSGDAVQLDPNRSAPGWDDVTIEGCTFWLAPLTEAENGLEAGLRTGENAVDTKTWSGELRARLVIRDTVAWGFRDSISNMAAFNLKEKVDVLVDGVTVYDSEIAFRVRGKGLGDDNGAQVRVQNAVIHTVDQGFRYEDEIQRLEVFHTTLGSGVSSSFHEAQSESTPVDARDLLVLGPSLPTEAMGESSNLAVGTDVFVSAEQHDYRLRPGAAPVDTGSPVAGVEHDRFGVVRPQGSAVDVGAYEYTPVLFSDDLERGDTGRWSSLGR